MTPPAPPSPSSGSLQHVGNAQRLWGDRMRQFVADHPEPCALPAPDLGRAEDYVVHANNNFTALTGQPPSEFDKKAVAAQKL